MLRFMTVQLQLVVDLARIWFQKWVRDPGKYRFGNPRIFSYEGEVLW